jgi:hypothetical protein
MEVFNFRLPSNEGIRPNTSQYHPEDGGDMFSETSVLATATQSNFPKASR